MRSRSTKSLFLAAIGVGALLIPALAGSAEPKVLRFAFQGELKSVDPYQINESFSLSVNGAVYEGLVRRGPDMKIEPCLATSWEVVDPCVGAFTSAKASSSRKARTLPLTTSFSRPIACSARAPTSRAAYRRTLRS